MIPDTETAILTRTNEEAGIIQNMLRDMPEDIRGSVAQVGTLHGAKGLEYDRVIMILNTLADRSGGLLRTFPSAVELEELEEERRLFYVGMIRAKDELILMGKSTQFLDELGLPDELAPDTPDVEDIETVTTEAVEASRTFRQRMERGFHEFRARYQKLRTYQDMADMERLGDVPTGEIVENLGFAQVHREKIEELGRDLGIEPSARGDRPTRLRGMDRLLANLHRPGKIQIAGYGGLVGADLSGATGGLGLGPRTALGLGTAALTKTFRAIDEFLYPHARRPGQQLDYRELHHPLPPEVLENLPEDIDPRNFRLVEQLSDDHYKPKFYEFAHPTEGWEGDAFERPLFFEGGFQMERLRNREEMERIRDEGLLSDKYTYLDTSQPSSGLRITPYDPLAQDTLYRPPVEPRSPQELSRAAIEYMERMREHVEDTRTSARRPSMLRRPGWRLRWEREHRRLLRPALGTGVDRFLTDNRTRDIVDFEQLHRVLTRLNPENNRVSMGIPFGSHDMAAQTIGLHNEVLDYLEQVRDPASPYFGAPTDIMAGGRLHQLPDGREGTADPDGIPRVDAPRFTMGQRARELFRRDRFRSPLRRFRAGDQLERAGLMIQTYDELGQKVRPGSGVYLGQGRVATALHTQLPLEYEEGMRTPTRATVQSVRGGEEIDVTGFLDFDEQLDLAILNLDQTNKAIKELESVPLGRGWIGRGRGLRTMGAGQFLEPGHPDVSADPLIAGEQTRIRLPFSTEGLRGSVGEGIGRLERTPEQIARRELNVFPVQSGSGVFSRGFFGDRLQGIIGGRSADHQGFFYPAQMVRRLLGRRAGVGGYQDVVSQFTPDTEGVITRAVKGRLDPLSARDRDRRAYQLLTAREQYIGEYTPEVSELESRLYDIQAAGALDTEGLEELGQIHTRLAEIQRPLQGEEGIDAEIRKALGPDTPTDIADIDPRIYSRSYQLGQRFQDTGIGGRLSRGVRATGDFLGSSGMRKFGRGLGKFGKFLGKTGIPIFELADLADKIDYFGGTAHKRITGDVVAGGDTDEIIERYRMLAESREFHTGSGLDVVGRLLGTGPTALEADYYEREGGLRDIGSWWSGLEWAERLPVVDEITVAWDKIEKGSLGRLFQTYADPTGRFAREDIDEQMAQIAVVLEQKRPTLNVGQRSALTFALGAEEQALTRELGAIGAFDTGAAGQRRAELEAELERVRAMPDGNIEYYSAGLGSYYTMLGSQTRSKAGVVKELEGKLAQLPDAQVEAIRQRLSGVREQRAGLGEVDAPITTGLRVALPTPFGQRMTAVPEPVIPQQLQERELPRIGPITPLTEALPRIGPITPLTRPEPIVVPGKGITIERPAPYTGAVTPLTEALTGAERESEMARRMGFVEEQAVAATEDITEPARMALADRLPAIHVGPGHTRERGYMGGDRFEQGREGWVYRMPEIGVVDQRPGVTPAVTPTAPYTAPYTPAVTPVAVEDIPESIIPEQLQEREPVIAPTAVPTIPEPIVAADTSMGLFRGMEQTDLNKQAYVILKNLEDGVVDGDTLKGMLFAPSLGIHGEEEKIRYLGFDSAETKPRDMDRYQVSRKHRTEKAVSTETKRGKEATKMHKEFLEQFKVGDEYHIPLEMDEFQERGKYGRVLASPLGAKDTYFKEAIEAGVARVYGSTAFLGGESTVYQRQDTAADIEKAKRHYARVDDDILRDARDQVYGAITAPAFTMRDRFAGMGETYTQAGLIGTGVDDFGIVGEAAKGRAQSQANLEAYQQQIQQQQVLLDTERDKFRRGDALEPSVEQSERVKALQESIQLAEKAAEAEQRAIKEYTRVIDQSSKLVQNMRKELLKSKIDLLKDERAVFQQTQKAEFTALQDQIKEQNRFRQGFGKEVLGDVGL